MGLETVTGITDLVITNPVGATDPKSQGDDHIRNIKKALKHDFPNITGIVTPTHTELNVLSGVGTNGRIADIIALTDPNADRIMFWDDSADAVKDLTPASNLTITGTSLDLSTSVSISGTLTAGTFSGSGASLTSLNASNISSGSLADARLSANVPLLSAANTFANASNYFGGGAMNEFGLTPTVGIANAGSAYLVVRDETNNVEALFGADSTSGLPIGTTTAHSVSIRSNNLNRLVINSSGNFDFKGGTVTTNNADASEVGYKGLPQNSQSTDYTCVLADAGKSIHQTGATKTVTIPANASVAFPIGTTLTFTNVSASNMTIAITTDTLFFVNGSTQTGSRTLANGGYATAIKTSSTTWLIGGVGLT